MCCLETCVQQTLGPILKDCPMKVWPALCFCFYFFCLFMIWLWWDLLWSRLIIFPHKLLSARSAESKPVFVFARLWARLGLTAATNHRRLSGHVHPGGATVHQSGAHQPVSGALCTMVCPGAQCTVVWPGARGVLVWEPYTPLTTRSHQEQ